MARLSKEEIVAKLKEMGYDAYVDKGVVFIFVSDEDYGSHAVFEKFRGVLKELGYNASWGFAKKGDRADV